MGQREEFLQELSLLLKKYAENDDLVVNIAKILVHYLQKGQCSGASDFMGAIASASAEYAETITRQTISRINSG